MNGLAFAGFALLFLAIWFNFLRETAADVAEPHAAERASANPNLAPADTCMAQGCTEEFVSSINGWRECASHLAARKAV